MVWFFTAERPGSRTLILLALALLVWIAGCADFVDGVTNGTEGTEPDQATDAPPEPTETPAEPTDRTLFWIGVLTVFVLGIVVASLLRRRNSSPPEPAAATPAVVEDPQTDAEREISLLHRNNGRIFEDVLEEELDWSPAHTRRVLSGLVAMGDAERIETETGVLVTFADPDAPVDEDERR